MSLKIQNSIQLPTCFEKIGIDKLRFGCWLQKAVASKLQPNRKFHNLETRKQKQKKDFLCERFLKNGAKLRFFLIG